MTTLTTSPVAARENRVLADRLGGTIAREIALVVAGTVVMIVLARISIPLPFTPVPVSLGTLGALSVGTTLGARRGLASVATYAILGVAGAPVFTGTNVGWAFASFGYILGYLLVAAIAGLAAQRGADRRVPLLRVHPRPGLDDPLRAHDPRAGSDEGLRALHHRRPG